MRSSGNIRIIRRPSPCGNVGLDSLFQCSFDCEATVLYGRLFTSLARNSRCARRDSSASPIVLTTRGRIDPTGARTGYPESRGRRDYSHKRSRCPCVKHSPLPADRFVHAARKPDAGSDLTRARRPLKAIACCGAYGSSSLLPPRQGRMSPASVFLADH